MSLSPGLHGVRPFLRLVGKCCGRALAMLRNHPQRDCEKRADPLVAYMVYDACLKAPGALALIEKKWLIGRSLNRPGFNFHPLANR